MFTQVQLETKTGPELVSIFNGIDGVSPVKRFRTREVGVSRILLTYANVSVGFLSPPTDVRVPLVKGDLTVGEVKVKKVRGIYNLPRKELIRIYRPNSRRGQLIDLLLTNGATFDELMANTDFNFASEDVLNTTIRILNWWTGYGISTNADGVIFLTS